MVKGTDWVTTTILGCVQPPGFNRVSSVRTLRPDTTLRGIAATTNGGAHRKRDFDEDQKSPLTAYLLTSAYGFELESWRMLQYAEFVLLHLKSNAGYVVIFLKISPFYLCFLVVKGNPLLVRWTSSASNPPRRPSHIFAARCGCQPSFRLT